MLTTRTKLVQKNLVGGENTLKPINSNMSWTGVTQKARHAKIPKVFLVFIILCCATPSFAANWFVRQSCANNGDGTASSCASGSGGAGSWKGFSNIAWNSVRAGDTINLLSGETYTPPLTVGKSGTIGMPITITVSGGGTATLDVAGVSGKAGINFGGNSYVTVDGVIGNQVEGQATYGIRIINIASSGTLNGYCVYENSGGVHNKVMHIECSGSTQTAPDDNGGGMYIKDAYSEIAYNWIHSSISPSKWHGTGITHWGSTGSTNYTDGIVHHNQVEYMFDDGIRCGSNCSLYNNVVRHIDTSGHSDSLLIQSGSYSAVYNNYVEGSGDQNIYLDNLYDSICGHIRIYNNVINSNPGFGLVIDSEGGAGPAPAITGCSGSGASMWNDVVIANNTFFSTSASSIRTSGRGTNTNLVILNNIYGIQSDGSYNNIDLQANTTFAGGVAWDYEVFSLKSANYPRVASWTNNYTLAQLKALSPSREAHSNYADPLFGGDFHLASTDTAATGKGINLASSYPFLVTDKDGVQRSLDGPWDLGAYKAPGSTGTTPPAAPPPSPTGLTVK